MRRFRHEADGCAGREHVRPPVGPRRALETVGREPLLHLDPQCGVTCDVLLARPATGPLTRDDRATLEDLAAPDAPGLVPLHRAGEALDAQRAVPAERLGQLQLRPGSRRTTGQGRTSGRAGSPPARQSCRVGPTPDSYARSPLSLCDLLDRRSVVLPACGGQITKAADPGYGFRGLEVSRWSVFRPAFLEAEHRGHPHALAGSVPCSVNPLVP